MAKRFRRIVTGHDKTGKSIFVADGLAPNVLEGEIHAVLDKGETLLKRGDILVQRGTNHSWSVRGSKPCIVAAVLVGAAPVGRLARKVPRKAAKRKSTKR